MAYEALETNAAASQAAGIAYKVAVFNLLALAAGVLACVIIKSSIAPGFAFGYILGLINIFFMLRMAHKGIGMKPEKAGRYVIGGYYIRFTVTSLLLAVLIAKGIIGPWPPILGLTGSVITTVGVMIGVMLGVAREEAV